MFSVRRSRACQGDTPPPPEHTHPPTHASWRVAHIKATDETNAGGNGLGRVPGPEVKRKAGPGRPPTSEESGESVRERTTTQSLVWMIRQTAPPPTPLFLFLSLFKYSDSANNN